MAVRGINRIDYPSRSTAPAAPSEQPHTHTESLPAPDRVEVIPNRSQSRNYGVQTLELTRNLERLQEAASTRIARNEELGSELDKMAAKAQRRLQQNNEQRSELNSLMGLPQSPSTSQSRKVRGLFGRSRR